LRVGAGSLACRRRASHFHKPTFLFAGASQQSQGRARSVWHQGWADGAVLVRRKRWRQDRPPSRLTPATTMVIGADDNREETMSPNLRTGFRRLLGTLCCFVASFIATSFVGAAFAATHDFNNDARSDILWRTGPSGQVVVWLMNGPNVIGGGSSWSAPGDRAEAGPGDIRGGGEGRNHCGHTNNG